MAGSLYLGVDLGTSQLKVGVIAADGRLLAEGRAAYTLDAPQPGWAEQDAGHWWRAFTESVAQVRGQVDLGRVDAVCVVAQSPTIVPVDANGRALRPALTWADRRASAEAAWLGEKVGTNVRVEFEALPRILWLKRHEADVFANTRWFLQAYDYLPLRLTGRAVTIYPHDRLRQWTPERLDAADLDRGRFPDESLPPGNVIGPVLPAVAAELGLRSDCLVVSGTVDAFAHWIGVDMTRPGRLCNVGGTSEGVSLYWPEPLRDPTYRVFGIPSSFDDGWMVGGSMSNGGSVLDWAARTLHGGADRTAVLQAAAAVTAGADGLIALPYLMGERTPIYDADARAALVGMGPNHGPEHMTRALLEGVAFGVRRVIEVLEEVGATVDEVTVTGGTSRAALWNRIKAAATGKPVRVPEVKDSGVMGAAILARSAAAGEPLSDVAVRMVRYESVIEPDAAEVAVYDRLYPVFRDLYGQLREPFQRLAAFRGESNHA